MGTLSGTPAGGPPAGTFLANVRRGVIEFPRPLKEFCAASGWTLFHVIMLDDDRLELIPVLAGDDRGDDTELLNEYHSSLSEDGQLWIPAALRELVCLGEQSVMMRVEYSRIRIYLRKVFKTLGFGP